MKDFLIIINKNAITSKDAFQLIKDNIARIGYTNPGDFNQPKGDTYKSMKGLTRWLTTLPVNEKPKLVLTKTYSADKYPTYDNYDAINVDKIKDIPYNYSGVMGVPVTILGYNLDNVEIVGKGGDIDWAESECNFFTPPTQDKLDEYKKNDKTWRVQNPYLFKDNQLIKPYNRIFIKIDGMLYCEYTKIDGEYIKGHRPVLNGKQLYSRVLIKKLN